MGPFIQKWRIIRSRARLNNIFLFFLIKPLAGRHKWRYRRLELRLLFYFIRSRTWSQQCWLWGFQLFFPFYASWLCQICPDVIRSGVGLQVVVSDNLPHDVILVLSIPKIVTWNWRYFDLWRVYWNVILGDLLIFLWTLDSLSLDGSISLGNHVVLSRTWRVVFVCLKTFSFWCKIRWAYLISTYKSWQLFYYRLVLLILLIVWNISIHLIFPVWAWNWSIKFGCTSEWGLSMYGFTY